MAETFEMVEGTETPTGEEVQPVDATGAETSGEPEAEGATPSEEETLQKGVEKRIGKEVRRTHEEREAKEAAMKDAAYWRGRAEERAATPEPEAAKVVPTGPLSPEQFETDEEYQDARIKRAVREETGKVTRELQERDRQRIAAESAERRSTAIGPDLMTKAQEVGAFATDTMLDAAGDQVKEVVEALVADPAESQRIGALPPMQQAVAIGEIKARLKAGPPLKKTTNAPSPPPSVGSGGSPPKKTVETETQKERFDRWTKDALEKQGLKP